MTGLEVALVLGGLTAGASALGAVEQNKATGRAADAEQATQDAAAAQRQQLTGRRLQELEGSIRSSSAGRGVAGSAVETSLLASTFESALLESSNIETNRFFQNLSTDARAGASFQSPLSAGVGGFAQGFSIGSSFGGGGTGGTTDTGNTTGGFSGGGTGAGPGNGASR